jgi:hypothetical protein
MSENIGRLAEVIADLNSITTKISDNDGLEFDIDERLSGIETAVENLTNEVEETIAFAEET